MTTKLFVRQSLLAKSMVPTYTRKDGVSVQSHDNGRRAAAGAPPKKGSASSGYVAPKEGEVGHHEHTEYGAYFRKGDKVKDRQGRTHEVLSHRGSQVTTTNLDNFHPTKLSFVSGAGK